MTEQSPADRLNRASNDIFEATSFLSGTNAAFLEALYAQYLANPECGGRRLAALISPAWASRALPPPNWAAVRPGSATSKAVAVPRTN